MHGRGCPCMHALHGCSKSDNPMQHLRAIGHDSTPCQHRNPAVLFLRSPHWRVDIDGPPPSVADTHVPIAYGIHVEGRLLLRLVLERLVLTTSA